MRDSLKITIPYQFARVLLTHMEAAGISFVFQAVAFWAFYDHNVFRQILGVIFTLIYAGFIFHIVRNLAELDYKEYTPLKPSVFKGVMFGVAISLTTLALYIIWRLIWIHSSAEGSLVGWGAILYNFVFQIWNFPFFGLMGNELGHIAIAGQIAMYCTPIAASTLGYLAAKNKLDILALLQPLIYEKRDQE